MVNINVVPEDLRKAARHMRDIAESVRDSCPSKGLDELPDALPGTQSAAAAESLQQAWTSRFHRWADDGMANHDAYVRAADYYQTTDAKIAQEALMKRLKMGESPLRQGPGPAPSIKSGLDGLLNGPSPAQPPAGNG